MFKSKKILTLVLAVVMLVQSFGLTGFAADINDYVDFPKNSWSTEAMTAAVDNGLLNGTSETTIEPAKNLTRAEFAAIVTRAFGATKTADISKFKDVDADAWYAEPIAKVVQMGVMNGTGNTTFAPDAFMRREDVILALARVLFVDGDDTSVLDQFSDRGEIDTWSVKAIAGMVSEGYVNGYEDGTIRPKDYISRQELAQLFHNIFKTYISEDGEYSSVAKKGSVIVRSEYVTLKDVTIDGDLIMADGIGGGDFRISNVHVTGKIIARGGEGMNYFVNVTSEGKVIVNDPNGTVNFYNYREEDTPFKGGNVIENTPATFLKRTPAPSVGGGAAPSYVLAFKDFDGNTFKTVSKSNKNYVIVDSDVPTDAQMEKDGYIFMGWSKDEDATTGVDRSEFVDKKLGDVKGTWYPVYVQGYEVVFYADEVGTGSSIKSETGVVVGDYVLDEDDVPTDTEMAKDGYEFQGWSLEGSLEIVQRSYFVGKKASDVSGKWYPVYVKLTTYKVEFKYNDGSVALDAVEKTLKPSEDYTLDSSDIYDVAHPTAPADYEFLGWSETANDTTNVVSSADLRVSVKDLDGKTYYAQFVKVTDNYTVVFKYTDGQEIGRVEKTLSESEDYVLTDANVSDVDFHTNPDDYIFLGWTETVDGTDYKTSAELRVSIKELDGKTFYAQYDRNETTYSVSFKYNDGTEALETVEKILVPSEDYTLDSSDVYDVAHPTAPSDYKFIGWSEVANDTSNLVASEDLEVSIRDLDGKTYYAQFEKLTDNFTVIFKYTDGTEIKKVEKTLLPSEDYTLGASDVSDRDYHTNPDDYIFLGWTETVDGTDYKTSTELRVSIRDLDGKTFYAQYDRNETTYTVSFKYNDGSQALPTVEKKLVPSEQYALDSSDVYDVEHPTAPADYVFLGWSEVANDTSSLIDSEELEVSIRYLDGKTYYAQFLKVTDNYTVVFKYTDGQEIGRVEKTLSASEDYILDASNVSDVDFHTNPADYTFLGWTDTIGGTDYKTSAELQVSIKDLDGKTYYAQYERNETTYSVSFKYEDGTEALPTVEKNLVASEDYVLTNADVKDVAHPTAPADYKFLGWAEAGSTIVLTSAELQVSIKDLNGKTYYAQFEKVTDSYTVVFKYTDGTEINKVEKTLSASEDYTLSASDVDDVDYHTNPADYTFLGWTDTVSGTDYKTSAELRVSIKDLDGKIYYAQYERNETTYSVSFKYEDGTEALPTVEKNLVASEDYVLTNADVKDVAHPTAPADYKFLGWAEAGSTTVLTSAELRVSIKDLDGKTYYAQFEEIEKPVTYTVEFKYTDGSEALPTVVKELLYAEDYVLTDADVYDVVYPENSLDYEFLGWTLEVDGTDYIASSELVGKSIKDLNGNTYYAQFEEIEKPVTYKVEFKYTDGSEALPTVVKELLSAEDYVLTFVEVYDVEYFEEPDMYEFLGWTETVDGTDYKTSEELRVSIKELDGKTFYAQFKHVDEVLYKVEHYFEQLDGTYTLEETEELYEYPGIDVTATALATLPEEYECENEEHEDRVAEGVVDADETLVLKLFYTRKVLNVQFWELGGVALEYNVKYGGTIDNFYTGDEFDASEVETIKADIDYIVEFPKIPGYGKDYDDEYLYNKFNNKLGLDEYYLDFGEYENVHEINYKWYVEDPVRQYVEFDEEHVFTEDLKIYSKIKKLDVVISFPSKLTDEVLTINVPYEESTRFLDSVRDALFINSNIASFPKDFGIEDLFYDKVSDVGGRFFGSDGFLNDEKEINNTDVMIYFYQMMGGKSAYRQWLWEEVETEVENTLGPRGNDTPRSQYESLRTMGLNQEQALYTFFEVNKFDLDFSGELNFAYNRYVDSKKFINDSSNKDQFLVTVNNEFIMEKVEEKISSLASVDSVITEYGGGRVPEGLLKRLPMDIVEDIYEPRIERFLLQLDEARSAAAANEPAENCMVDSGIYFDVNLVEELLIPMFDFAEESHDKAVKKAVKSGNKAAELVEKYYVDNPYVVGDIDGVKGVVNYGFDYTLYIEDEDSDGMYTIKPFETIYTDSVMPLSVESIDALLWYMDPEGGSVDITKITDLARDNEALVLALHNHPNNLMAKYAVEGLPKDMVTYWEDLLSDPEIAKAVEKLDDKVDGYKNLDLAFFVESKLQKAVLEMYFLKVLDKVGVPVESILGKYTNSQAFEELTPEDLNKLLDQLDECWTTEEVEIDGVMVFVENANGTTDYVFDNVLEKVGSSGNYAEMSIKGFELSITRFFADEIGQTPGEANP